MLVILESPYAGDITKNLEYAHKCVKDCFNRGEYPFASNILYTIALDDKNPEDRDKGIEAGLKWGKHAKKTVVYTDYGISKGMKYGIDNAVNNGRQVEYRNLWD